MKTTTELFKVNGKVLCARCMAERNLESATVRKLGPVDRDEESLLCELCGAKLRILCPNCGNFHLDPLLDIEQQARQCLDQERISIEAERLEFYDKWL